MNIVSLQTFLAIVETGSLVRASAKMNVTQSTVTARLKSLERELGQVLLKRQKSGATLTPAGARLMRYAKVMTGLWRQARRQAGLPAGVEGVCAFGCHRDLWYGPGKALLGGIVAERPQMALSISLGSQPELEEWLDSGYVDMILAFGPAARGSAVIHTLPPEQLILVSDRPETPTHHDPGYVFVDHGADFHRRHDEAYFDADTARISFDSAACALEFLLEHGGSAYLAHGMVEAHLSAGRLHRVVGAPSFPRNKHLIVSDAAGGEHGWLAPLIARAGSRQIP